MSGALSFFAGSPKATTVAGFKVQTAVAGRPIPIVYGQARIAGNIVHMPAIPGIGARSKQQSKGADGGTTYTAPIVLALCEGPIGGINYVWRDKDQFLTYTGNYDVKGFVLFLGTSAPTAWSYLTTNFPAEAVPYQFTAFIANPSWPLPNDSMSSYSWDVEGFLQFGGGVVDASPAAIIPDLLESDRYGLGWSSARIGSTTVFADYCAAFGLFASPALENQAPARDYLNELLEVSNTGAVWSDGVLKLIPYGDVAGTGNGHTYTPNTTPLYDLTDTDFLSMGTDSDPIKITRKDPATAYNVVTIEYEQRDFPSSYNATTYEATDQFAAATYGKIAMPTLSLHSIKLAAVAQQVAQVRLQREQNIRNVYTFRLGWKFALLEPMDLVTLTDAQLGLSFTPVRITSVSELSAEAGFEMTAEDWPFGTASATRYGIAGNGGINPNANVDPGNTSTPVIVDGPSAMASAPLEIWIGAGGGQYWGGADVYFSVDNVTFTKVGTLLGKAAIGAMTATLATFGNGYPTVDGSSTASISIAGSSRTMSSFSATDFANLRSLCYVEGASAASPEWIAYETATLTGPSAYNLTTLYRGVYGSTIASHVAGKKFMLIDDAVAKIPWPQGKAGQTIYVKLPAFNIYGGSLQDVATVSSTAYVIGQGPTVRNQAIAQGTVSFDPIVGNTSAQATASASADGPSNALSYRYAFAVNTSFPSDSSTQSGGTIVNGRSFSVTNFVTVNLGDIVYLTIVPFDSAGANGNALLPIHLRGAFTTFAKSKSVTYSGASWLLWDPVNTTWTRNGSGQPVNDAFAFPNGPIGSITLEVAPGVKLHQMDVSYIWNAAATKIDVWNVFVVVNNTTLNFGALNYAGGAQVKTIALSDTVLAASQNVFAWFEWGPPVAGTASAGQATAGDITLTYIMPDPGKAL